MNLILRNLEDMKYHTKLKLIFDSLEGKAKDFNWLITSHEVYTDNEVLNKDFIFISGEELSKIVKEDDIQFIWGIISGFPKETDVNLEDLKIVPNFDGEWRYSKENLLPQHPLATIEIVCVDSSYTIIISKDRDLSNRILRRYPKAEDLNEFNNKFKNI